IGSEVNQSTIDSLNDTVEKLKKLGHEVVEDTVPVDGQQAIHSYFTMNMVETAAMFKDMEKALGREIKKDDVELISYGMYHSELRVPGWMYTQSLNYWDTLSELYYRFIDDNIYDFYLRLTINVTTNDINSFTTLKESI